MRNQSQKVIFRITFHYLGKVYTLFANSIVSADNLYGMVVIEEIAFKQSKRLIVASEEDTKNEFKGVKRLYLPYHSILRVDELQDFDEESIKGPQKLTHIKDNVIQPVEFFRPPR